MPQFYEVDPYWIDYGEYRDFCYFQTNYFLMHELLKCCPHLFKKKWAVLTSIDCDEMRPPGHAPQWKKWNRAVQLKKGDEYPVSMSFDEIYLFDREVQMSELQQLTERQTFGDERMSTVDLSMFDAGWAKIDEVNACSLIIIDGWTTFIFKDKKAARKFQGTGFYKRISTIHIDKMKAMKRNLLNFPIAWGRCAQPNCNKNRVMFGVNCPRHHFIMIEGHAPEEEGEDVD